MGRIATAGLYQRVLSKRTKPPLFVTAVIALLGTLLSPIFNSLPAHAVTAPVLLAHWKFDEPSTGTNANDDIGTNDGVPGTLSATLPTPSADVPPVAFTNTGSMQFNGQNYFTINNPVSTNFTICAWIKTSSTGGGVNHWTSAPIMDAEWGGVNFDFGFGVGNGGKLMFGNGGTPVGGGGLFDAQANGTTTINDNTWHNVCVTRNNTTGLAKLYVDANLDGSSTTGVGSLTVRSTARIGWGYDGAALYQGLIDDVRVYNTDLNLQQLQNLAAGNNSPSVPTVTINSPTASSAINSWNPTVNWGTSDECAYSWDNSTWNSVNCTNNGADIPAPNNGNGLILHVRANATGDTTYGIDQVTFTYDTVAPTVEAGNNYHTGAAFSLDSALTNDAVSGVANISWSKLSGPGAVTFSDSHVANPSVTTISQDGTYALRLTVTDNVGNSAFDDVTVVWDATKPDIAWSLGGFPDSSTSQTTATFAFTGSDSLSAPVTYKCKLDSGTFVSCTSPTTVNKLEQGSHTFVVRATDNVGNTTDDLTYTWTVIAVQENDQNGDGIVDVLQDNVTSLESGVTSKTVALEVAPECEVENAAIKTEGTNAVGDPGFDYPQGLLDFTVNCGANGFTTTVTQYYYDVSPSELSLRKYNPNTKKYTAVGGATITTKNVYGHTVTTVTYEITDGGALDADGIQNGVIVDPAGLAAPVSQNVVSIPVLNTSLPKLNVTLPKTGASFLGLPILATALCALGIAILLFNKSYVKRRPRKTGV